MFKLLVILTIAFVALLANAYESHNDFITDNIVDEINED